MYTAKAKEAPGPLLDTGADRACPSPHVACVIDLDNILHRGFDKRGLARPQAQLNITALSAALRECGVTIGTICRNREFPAIAELMWARLGFKVVATRKNCDDAVIAAAGEYARAGIDGLILVAGDGDYQRLVTELRAQGVNVEIWSRRATASQKLIRACGTVRYIDDLLFQTAVMPAQEASSKLGSIDPSSGYIRNIAA